MEPTPTWNSRTTRDPRCAHHTRRMRARDKDLGSAAGRPHGRPAGRCRADRTPPRHNVMAWRRSRSQSRADRHRPGSPVVPLAGLSTAPSLAQSHSSPTSQRRGCPLDERRPRACCTHCRRVRLAPMPSASTRRPRASAAAGRMYPSDERDALEERAHQSGKAAGLDTPMEHQCARIGFASRTSLLALGRPYRSVRWWWFACPRRQRLGNLGDLPHLVDSPPRFPFRIAPVKEGDRARGEAEAGAESWTQAAPSMLRRRADRRKAWASNGKTAGPTGRTGNLRDNLRGRLVLVVDYERVPASGLGTGACSSDPRHNSRWPAIAGHRLVLFEVLSSSFSITFRRAA